MSESIPSPSMSPSTFRSLQGSITHYAPQSQQGLRSPQDVESVALPTLIIGIEPVLADGQATLAADASSESDTTLWKIERRWSADPTLPTLPTLPTRPIQPAVSSRPSIAASPSDPSSDRAVRHVAAPLDESLRPLIRRFHNDATRFLEREVDRQSLAHVAAQIGDRLAAVFDAAEWDLLERGGENANPPAFLVIESSDETVLGLPWELVRVRGTYIVRDGRLDIVRSVTTPGGDAPSVIVRHPPAAPVRIHINVCAPELPDIPALRYEEESYRILQAMYVHEGVRVNDMGEVNDLLDAVRGDADAPPVDVVHFSGHGSPGVLHFESDTGDDDPIAVGDLIRRMRAYAAGRVPSLFYLASCHGHSTSAVDGWADQLSTSLRSTAALLHGAGVAQVVAHVGVIDDRLSTDAEVEFYAALAEGRSTREGVRRARAKLAEPFRPLPPDRAPRTNGPSVGATGEPDGGLLPFAWALQVLYQRGADYPLGTKVPPGERLGVLRRQVDAEYQTGNLTKVLKTGFIGRRRQLHELRRRIRGTIGGQNAAEVVAPNGEASTGAAPRPVTVVHGLGGVGKSTFCWKALALFREAHFVDVPVWCGHAEHESFTASVSPGTRAAAAAGEPWQEATIGAWFVRTTIAAIDKAVRRNVAGRSSELSTQWKEELAKWNETPPLERLFGVLQLAIASPAFCPPLTLYFDNLESLLKFPRAKAQQGEGDDSARTMPWRDPSVRDAWNALRTCAHQSPQRLRVLASTRYVPARLPADEPFALPVLTGHEVLRMMDWFEHLKRLSPWSKSRLARLVAGHGRSLEFLDDLIGTRLAEPIQISDSNQEWETIVAPCLAAFHERLREDLLFQEIWNHVLRDSERTLLIRLTALSEWSVVSVVAALFEAGNQGDDAEPPDEASFQRLRRLSLVEEERDLTSTEPLTWFSTHPVIDQFVAALAGERWEVERRWAAARLAAFFDERFEENRGFSEQHAAGRYHLAAGNLNEGAERLGNLAEYVMGYGRVTLAKSLVAPLVTLEAADRFSGRQSARVPFVMATIQVMAGDLTSARNLLERAIRRGGQLVQADPGDAESQADLAWYHGKLGDVSSMQGDLTAALLAYRATFEIRQRLAQADPENVAWQRDLAVSHNDLGDVARAQGDLTAALTAYRAAFEINQRLAQTDPENVRWQRDLAGSHDQLGDVARAQGNLADAVTAYRAGLQVRRRLVQEDPEDSALLHALSVSYGKLGDVVTAQGDLSSALAAYRAGLEITQRLVEIDPGNADWQRNLAIHFENVGDVARAQGDLAAALSAYHASFEILQRLVQTEPENTDWQRELSVSHDRMGNIARAQGDLTAAQASYRASLEIRERLTRADSGNAEWQRDLSISYDKLGDVAEAQEELTAALAAYRAALDIRQRLTRKDPENSEWLIDLSFSHDNLGDVARAQGDLRAALTAYRAGLKIRERLTKSDPENAEWQRELSVSHDKLGDVARAQGNLNAALTAYRAALEIRKRLAESDPENALWQEDLATSHDQVGDVANEQGELAAALVAYRAALKIRQRLTEADPDNAAWQRALTVSHERIGDIVTAQGDLTAALTAYRAGLEISRRLVQLDPGNALWQVDLALSYERVGDTVKAQGDLTDALAAYRDGFEIRQRLTQADPENVEWQRELFLSYMRLGDVARAQNDLAAARAEYQAGFEIRHRLTEQDHENVDWRRDELIIHDRLGHVSLAQGDMTAALAAFRAQFEICQWYTEQYPEDTEWQVDLAISHDNLGDVASAMGNRNAALAAYRASLTIYEQLLELDATNNGWQEGLEWAHEQIARVKGTAEGK